MQNKQKTLDEVDSMLAELGLNTSAIAPTSPSVSAGFTPSRGPGGGFSSGGSVVSSGPGGSPISRGPGVSRGPGAAAAAARAQGAGGPARPAMATHTSDGREIKFSGPDCAVCGEMICVAVTNALDKTYHPECFRCAHCRKPFGNGKNFIEDDGKPYCEEDYNALFVPKCGTCMHPIIDKHIRACGKVFHPDHFFCDGCGTSLAGKPFKEEEGEALCMVCKGNRAVRLDPAAGICGKCKKPIIGEYIVFGGQRMHPEHYRCEECGCEFRGGNCHEYEAKLYCYPCYLKLLKSICDYCKKPVVGRSVTALGKVFHPEHFLCATCNMPFTGARFNEHLGKAYCDIHYQQFAKICETCNKPIMDEGIAAFGKNFHKDHFVCNGCGKQHGKEIWDFESKALCRSCYKKLPKEVRKRLGKKKEGEVKAQKEREKAAMKAMRGK